MSRNQAAKQFGVAISTAIGWMKRVDETGSGCPGEDGRSQAEGGFGILARSGCRDGSRTVTSPYAGLFAELAGRGLKLDTITRCVDFVHAEKFSFKFAWWLASRHRPDVARRRAQWTKYQGRVEAERLVFLDETWTRTDMAPLRGWAPRGRKVFVKVPHGRWKTMTFLAALRNDRIDAPWFIEGPIDGESFRTYVEKVLLPPSSRRYRLMDNLGSQEAKPCASSSAPPEPSCSSSRNLTRPQPHRTGGFAVPGTFCSSRAPP